MREIKFRAWLEEHKIFCAPVYMDGVFYVDEELTMVANSVEQFTGLYDENSKEIYEGDILRPKSLLAMWEMQNYVVEYRGTCFVFMGETGTFDLVSNNNISKIYMEIIGNIHENSELLEE